ncbi:hypothetical protein CEW87_19270 [Parazoarcus communis]|uniref:Photosynthesis system II assembly factor Ycf48/Hcf136-like domain-containing protein n=1 Tax=Parazoarcus communis TaxID=41977 RepID=A0A2U8H6X6_9RHOO|nr:hypothetical protein [Parazoarcus communis]AWI81320.1 hypothetical protein CEW87_19270 [Parazoarcus communis]
MSLRSELPLGASLVIAAWAAFVLWACSAGWSGGWTSIGPEGGSVRTIAFDRLDARVLYAGTLKGGVFRSLDGAQSWQRANAGLAGVTVVDIAAGALTPSRLFAATDSRGVFRSADRGRSWRACNAGLDVPALRSIVIDPTNPAALLVASFGGGIYRSDDACESWHAYSTGLNDAFVNVLATDMRAPGTVYAGTGAGLYRLRPGSPRWVGVGVPTWYVQDVLVDPASGAILVALPGNGVLVSRDDGKTWADASLGLDDAMVTGLARASGGTLHAGAQSGEMFRSVDGARSWQAVAAWRRGTPIEALATDARLPGHIHAGTRFAGVEMSRDAGASWRAANRGLHNVQVEALVIDPGGTGALPQVIHVGSRYSGAFRSVDGGRTWEAGRGIPDAWVSAVVPDPVLRSRVYAVTGRGLVLVSHDRGAHWLAVGQGAGSPLLALAVHPRSTGVMLAGGAAGQLFATRDGGQHWDTLADFSGAVIQHIVFDPLFPDTVYVATSKGIYKGAAGGTNWRALNTGLQQPDIQALAIDPLISPAVIYAATEGGGVLRSADGGEHWRALNSGLTDPFIRAVAIDPEDSTRLYAGGRSGRIFRTYDAGLSWRSISKGADLPSITVLAVDPAQPRRVFAATAGNSVVVETQTSGWAWIAALIATIVLARALMAGLSARHMRG